MFGLLCRRPKDLSQGSPEANCAIADSKIGRVRKAASLEVQQKFAPVLGAFAIALREAEDFLAAPLIRADRHRNALFFLHSWLEIDAVRPDINDPPGAEVAFLPAFVILPPVCFEP